MYHGRFVSLLALLLTLSVALPATASGDCTAAGARADAGCKQDPQDFFGEVPDEDAPAKKPVARPALPAAAPAVEAAVPATVTTAPSKNVAAMPDNAPPLAITAPAPVKNSPAAAATAASVVAPTTPLANSPAPVAAAAKPIGAAVTAAPAVAGAASTIVSKPAVTSPIATTPKATGTESPHPLSATATPTGAPAPAGAPSHVLSAQPATAAATSTAVVNAAPPSTAGVTEPVANTPQLPDFFRDNATAAASDDMVIRESRRIALVIGNGSYPNAPLKNPPNDAELMAHTLESMGFEVMVKTNADQREMKGLISEFGAKIKRGGVGLFYYAGHGLQIDGENYLIPVDAQIEQEADVDAWGVNVTAVLKQMGKADNHLNLVILDACRDNPFARSWRGGARGLAELEAPVGTYIAYATAPGQTASDGDGDNGLYTAALTSAMEIPGARLEDIFMNTRRAVRSRSGGKQVPWENGSLTGVFYINQEGAPTSATQVATAAPADSGRADNRELLELAVWSSVKASMRKEDLNLYLGKFPHGRYVDDARKRLAYLDSPLAMIDAAPPGAYLDSTGLPLLDSTVPHRFGNWTILRKPSRSRVRVLPVGAGKLPEIQTQGSTEDYYFYYEPLSSVAALLHIEDGDDSVSYRNEKTAVRLRNCRRTAGTSLPLRKNLDFAVASNAVPINLPAGYAVWLAADRKDDSDRKIRISDTGDRLDMLLPDKTVTLHADSPTLEMVDLESGGSCRFR